MVTYIQGENGQKFDVRSVFRDLQTSKMQNEIKHLKKVFRDINGYPNWTIEQTLEKVKNQNEIPRSTQVTTNTEENEHLLMLPYKGKVGETTLKYLRNFKVFRKYFNVVSPTLPL